MKNLGVGDNNEKIRIKNKIEFDKTFENKGSKKIINRVKVIQSHQFEEIPT